MWESIVLIFIALIVLYKNRKPVATFGKTSNKRLLTCHAVLQDLMKRVVSRRDCMIACGHRGEEDQNEAFDKGFSKLRFPQSKHNKSPSMAVDVVPWPEKWDDKDAFIDLCLIIREEWDKMEDEDKNGFKLRWGGNWDIAGCNPLEYDFIDLPHWEILGE